MGTEGQNRSVKLHKICICTSWPTESRVAVAAKLSRKQNSVNCITNSETDIPVNLHKVTGRFIQQSRLGTGLDEDLPVRGDPLLLSFFNR